MPYKKQTCGKKHAYCSICRPEVAAKVGSKKGCIAWNKGLTGVQRGYWKDKHLPAKMRAKISATVSRSLIGNQRAKGNRFSHTDETKAKISMNRSPIDFTPELRARIAKGVAKAHIRGDYWGGPTCLEYALQMLLEDAGLEFNSQIRFGRYVVDSYVSSRNLVFEADGSFWNHHKDKEREQMRDNYLIEKGVLAVVHLDEHDLDPWREA